MVLTCVFLLENFSFLTLYSLYYSNMATSTARKRRAEADTGQVSDTRASTRTKTASSKQKEASKSPLSHSLSRRHTVYYNIQVSMKSARPARRLNASSGCSTRKNKNIKNILKLSKVCFFSIALMLRLTLIVPHTRDLRRNRSCAGIQRRRQFGPTAIFECGEY